MTERTGHRAARFLRVLPGILLCTAWLLHPGEAAASARVSVEPDRTRMSPNELLRVRVTVEGESVIAAGSPEGDDFTVHRHSMRTQSQQRPGRPAIQHTVIDYHLRANRTGRLLVGRVPIRTPSGMTHTEPFTVVVDGDHHPAPSAQPRAPAPRVASPQPAPVPDASVPPGATPAPPPPPGSAEMVTGPMPTAPRGQPFLVASLSTDTPVVGEPFVVDFLLHVPSTQMGLEIYDMDDPVFEGFWFNEITRARSPRRQSRLGAARVRGELHDIHLLRSYSVVPLREGLDELPPVGAHARIRGFFQDDGEVHLRSLPAPLRVRPVPADGRPAGHVDANVGSVHAGWALSHDRVETGTPTVLTLHVSGHGLVSRFRLPDLPVLDGVEVEPPRDRFHQERGVWPSGESVREWRLRPLEPGSFDIPALEMTLWDPWAGDWLLVRTEPLRLVATGAPAVHGASPPVADAPWQAALPPFPDRSRIGPAPQRRLAEGWVPWFLAALPFFVLAALLLGPRWRDAMAGRRRPPVLVSLLEPLEKQSCDAPASQALGAATRALHAALTHRLGRETRGLTEGRLRGLVGPSEERLVDLLGHVERARYAGSPSDESRVLVDAVIAEIRALGLEEDG